MKLDFQNSIFFNLNPKIIKYQIHHVISMRLNYILRPISSNSVKNSTDAHTPLCIDWLSKTEQAAADSWDMHLTFIENKFSQFLNNWAIRIKTVKKCFFAL